MLKGLEALKKIKWKLEDEGILGKEYELCDLIENELKAFEIIKEHIVLNRAFDDMTKGDTEVVLIEIKALIPKEEYPLLREALK